MIDDENNASHPGGNFFNGCWIIITVGRVLSAGENVVLLGGGRMRSTLGPVSFRRPL